MKTQKENSLEVESLRFTFSNYNNGEYTTEKHWAAEFTLNGSREIKSISLKLDPQIAEHLMRVLLPIVTASAAKEAQNLADSAQQQANELSKHILKQLPE